MGYIKFSETKNPESKFIKEVVIPICNDISLINMFGQTGITKLVLGSENNPVVFAQLNGFLPINFPSKEPVYIEIWVNANDKAKRELIDAIGGLIDGKENVTFKCYESGSIKEIDTFATYEEGEIIYK